MCYVCGKCKATVPHGVKRMLEIEYRKNPMTGRMEIAKETPVCINCTTLILNTGEKVLYGDYHNTRTVGMHPMFHTEQDRQTNPLSPEKEYQEQLILTCDVCFSPLGEDGQVTEQGVLCAAHLPGVRNKKAYKKQEPVKKPTPKTTKKDTPKEQPKPKKPKPSK